MASVGDFQDRFPEFCDVDDTRVQMFLDDSALIMSSPKKWLDFYDLAQMYLTAHYLCVFEHTASGDVSSMAPIRRQEVDDTVIEFATAHVDNTIEEFYGTAYGKRYLQYRKIIFAGPVGV